jgi:nucleoside-diphosphate-sugar epimerase
VRVAVTGGTGHLGSALLPRLREAGHDVRALVHRRLLAGYDTVVGDLVRGDGLTELVDGADAVIHLGAKTRGLPANLWETNAGGTRQLGVAARRAGARFVHISTLAVLGGGDGDERLLASGDERGLPPYAASKAAAELALGQQAPISAIVRPGWVLAPGDAAARALGPLLRRGLYPVVGTHTVPVIDPRDVADAIIIILREGAAGAFHVVPDNPPTLRTVLRTACLSHRARPLGVPVPGGFVRALVEDVGSLWPQVRRLGAPAVPHTYTNVRLRALGWEPRVPLEDTVAAWTGGTAVSPEPLKRP